MRLKYSKPKETELMRKNRMVKNGSGVKSRII